MSIEQAAVHEDATAERGDNDRLAPKKTPIRAEVSQARNFNDWLAPKKEPADRPA
jgi:hypothetical protein